MAELNIEAFDPTVAELTKMVEETKGIMPTDLLDKEQIEVVKKARLGLRNVRVRIEKTGKAMREDALAFQKKVIAKENELIAIIEPEEDRLAGIEEEAKKQAIMKERKELLPLRLECLAKIGDDVPQNEDDILAMDDLAFQTYFNGRVADKNEADRKAIEAKKLADEKELKEREDKLHEEERKQEEEKRAREREEKARQEERERLEREQREKEEREERERIAREKKEAEDKAKRERADNYRAFRAEHGWTEETKDDFYEKADSVEVVLFKKVGTFKL